MLRRVLAISDTQAPFQHRDTLPFLQAVAGAYQCDTVVHLGDEIDCHALSDFDHNPDGFSAGHELAAALRFIEKLYAIFPRVKVCESNHTRRPLRRAFKSGIPSAFMRTYREFMGAPPGWVWAPSWEIDGVRYEHGDAIGGASHTAAYRLALMNGVPTVFGHRHSGGGLVYVSTPARQLWGLNVGCLIDTRAYAFNYFKGPIGVSLGCGVVADCVPHFVPMVLDARGRWRGRL